MAAAAILHDKFAIFDGRLLFTGSYNWSTNAEENNDENAVFLRNTSVIAAFQTTFNFDMEHTLCAPLQRQPSRFPGHAYGRILKRMRTSGWATGVAGLAFPSLLKEVP